MIVILHPTSINPCICSWDARDMSMTMTNSWPWETFSCFMFSCFRWGHWSLYRLFCVNYYHSTYRDTPGVEWQQVVCPVTSHLVTLPPETWNMKHEKVSHGHELVMVMVMVTRIPWVDAWINRGGPTGHKNFVLEHSFTPSRVLTRFHSPDLVFLRMLPYGNI